MTKGRMSGSPTNIVCWLVGGYFNQQVYSIAYDRDNLLSEIQMHHYENPTATKMGVQILGITQASPQDELKVENYELVYSQETVPAFAVYVCREDGTMEKWHKGEIDTQIKNFIRDKGYDLPSEHLDPKQMSGTIRTVNVE